MTDSPPQPQTPPPKRNKKFPQNFQLSSSITLNTLNSWQCLHNILSELSSSILQLIKRISIYLLCVTVLHFGTRRKKEANFTFPCGVNWESMLPASSLIMSMCMKLSFSWQCINKALQRGRQKASKLQFIRSG